MAGKVVSEAGFVTDSPSPPKLSVLGIGISVVTYESAAVQIISWARRHESRTVSALAVHGVMTGVLDSEHGARLNQFDMLTPDGQPVRWAMNLMHNADLGDRVYGPELTDRLCKIAARERVGVYFYGSRPEVVATMASNLQRRHPGLLVAGLRPSRFRDSTPDEDADDVREINSSGAGIVFVGLGCPRQEMWTHAHRGQVNAVMIAVGAAFDFHAGKLRQAPAVMQRFGLEWLFRLGVEPRRLWRRYLFLNPAYLFLILLQWTRLQGRRARDA